MRTLFLAAAAAAFVSACAGGVVPGILMTDVSATSPHIQTAITDSRRPEADTTRDALRHPSEILAFAQISPGQRVADIGPGGGYYTRLFSVAVGEQGRVYAIDRPNASPDRPRAILAVAPAYPNVTVVQQGYQGWTVPEPLDVVFVSQIYHDWFYPQLSLDVPALNRQIFDALRPGGLYVIIDHAAAAGHTLDPNPQTDLHRIDQAQIIREVTAAGFVLDGESQVLRNPADNHSVRVFEGDIRGHTDQFVLRFRKPE